MTPALCVGAAIGLAAGLVVTNHKFNVTSPVLFQGPPSGARTSLNSIITAMISLTGLVFSVTFVALQLTAGQLSPRVLQVFLRDRIIHFTFGVFVFTFGVFVATFVYAMVVLQTVKGSSSDADVPRLAVSVAFLLVFASAGVFTLYIAHVAQMMRASTVIAEISHESRGVLDRIYPTDPVQPKEFDRLSAPARVVEASREGLLIGVNESGLVELAGQAQCVIVVEHRQGDYVPEGAKLFTLHGEPDDVDHLVKRANKQLVLGAERAPEQDLAFGFRQLTDVADRALSPSTNDPTTACRALDALHTLFRRLATRPPAPEAVCGPDRAVRLVMPRYQFSDLLDMTMTEVWHYGSDEVQVPERVARMLDDLAEVARPEHQEAVKRWIDVVGASPRWSPLSPRFRVPLFCAKDHQPFGGAPR
ncbi:DUF2254 domain-containing protein [Candidatus Mycobacterium methanotrophicum]|uniref:DUF2254 domain-containing protein n=1 Tax=Candidatus Mycobacterium methanotrophicum TaxID=2943498 RepID=A0ABY4QJC5_9MYCO|nr:DUF2254 domain-containing protein [Candidatus Mycobacterium methanotrophicum]UQX09903.1 DUF2254 domain-containing protein [Candidatus Mycobacterium methanotrophicum]